MTARFGDVNRVGKMVNLDFWLTVGRGQGHNPRPSVKVTAAYPSLARNEIAMNLKIDLPMVLFETPSLAAQIKVEKPDQPISIDTTQIAEAVRRVIGMDVNVTVVADGEQS